MPAWHVYQFRSDTELLYVGYTRYLKKRISQHRVQKSWWSEVTDIGAQEFATEDEARQREKEIWATEHPKYNRHSPFLTDLEYQEAERKRMVRRRQMPEYQEAERKRNRTRNRTNRRTPEYRAYMREYRRRSAAGHWQQTGPGLF